MAGQECLKAMTCILQEKKKRTNEQVSVSAAEALDNLDILFLQPTLHFVCYDDPDPIRLLFNDSQVQAGVDRRGLAAAVFTGSQQRVILQNDAYRSNILLTDSIGEVEAGKDHEDEQKGQKVDI